MSGQPSHGSFDYERATDASYGGYAPGEPAHGIATEDVRPNRITESRVSTLVEDVLNGAAVSGRAGHQLIATGFGTLDKALGGGMHVGDLCIVGGLPGAGKTIATLQWARNMAQAGNEVLYLCYEHDVATLLGRLLAMEIGNLGAQLDASDSAAVASALAYTMNGAGDPDSEVLRHPLVRAAMSQIDGYAPRLVLSQAPHYCDLALIEKKATSGDYGVVVVDYLQKIPSLHGVMGIDRYTNSVEGLKNLALDSECLVIAVSAVDAHAMEERRLKVDGLRGAHALAHEADVIMTLNNKINVVSRTHLAYDSTLFDRFSQESVFTIEKNRRGMAPVYVECTKDFQRFRFEPKGRFVAEKLIDDVVVKE